MRERRDSISIVSCDMMIVSTAAILEIVVLMIFLNIAIRNYRLEIAESE